MNSELYAIIALAARYWFCALMVIVVFRGWRLTVVDNRRARILRAWTPETGCIGEFLVNPGKNKRRYSVPIPKEGLLGSAGSADVQIKNEQVKKSHAYLEQREEGLLLRPLHGASVEFHGGVTGDQLLLRDGDVIALGDLRLMLVLFDSTGQPARMDARSESEDDFSDIPVKPNDDGKPTDDFFDEDETWQEKKDRRKKENKR